MRRFFDQPVTRWRNPKGALHVYALPKPDSDLVNDARRADQVLKDVPQLAIQPLDYLHMTLQRLDLYRSDLDDKQWERLLTELESRITELDAFGIDFVKPQVRQTAVEVVGKERVKWQQLVDSIREAFKGSGLGSAVMEPPFGPHYTLAYCVQDADKATDSQIQRKLDEVSVETNMHINQVWLVEVTESPKEGVFSFDRLAKWSLR
ncbi:2'-5' RNA ligase family protein [Bifidobacterium sp. ESL0732]|uniref:2'-5' RNA ligase family protein n=1 Tax=Bifidobacterium sp. ESL0732 TaxID=2983222 RepID=UPI0023F6C48B|nr:2'-5' RNA ligase family protein [Bifidobacterium sp. ESL0732]WEV64265.1 2'-5' RNA ligase family protein [Bifidobacterium sp. ESL0732]